MKHGIMNDFWSDDPLSNGSKGLVFIGEDILIYRRDTNTTRYPLALDLPGGGAEHGETPFITFKREVYEEFGLRILPKHIVYARRYPSSTIKGKFGWFPVARLPATCSEEIVFGDEGEAYFLMSISDYLQRNDAWPVFQERTRNFLADTSKEGKSV